MIWHATMTTKLLHRDTAAAWREAVLYIIGAFLVISRKGCLLWIGPVFRFRIQKLYNYRDLYCPARLSSRRV